MGNSSILFLATLCYSTCMLSMAKAEMDLFLDSGGYRMGHRLTVVSKYRLRYQQLLPHRFVGLGHAVEWPFLSFDITQY